MVIPSKKNPEIEKFLEETSPKGRRKSIENDTCSWCGGDASTFRDALSEKEYTLSGFCQKCQDETFER
jgi:rRNA maturation protein Nop10